MLGRSPVSMLLLLTSLCFFLGSVNGVPLLKNRSPAISISVRASDGSLQQPVTVNTTNNIQTTNGMMIENCAITLVPFTSDDGEDLVQETKACTLNAASSGGAVGNPVGASPPASAAPSDAPPSSPSSAGGSPPAVTTSGAQPTDSTAAPSTGTASTTLVVSPSGTASATDGGAISVGSVSFLSITSAAGASSLPSGSLSATPSGSAASTATASGTQSSQSPSNNDAQPVSVMGWSNIPMPTGALGSPTSNNGSTPTQQSDTVSSSAAAFAVPGRKLLVLPVGLGVFAGITGITLIIVGMVTYERMKYRKAFRQRKLAEQGSAMGYGGMAQVA